MLYVSTRNTAATYTAHRAIHEARTQDGGFYVPFHLPAYTQEELLAMKAQPCCNAIAAVLNLLFAKKLTGSDVEFAIGKNPFRMEYMQHKLVFAESWHNPEGSADYLLKNLYTLISDRKYVGKLPAGWSDVGIRIALLFGMYSALENTAETFDMAVTAGDFADISAILYCRGMGLPVNMTVCTGSEDCVLWDLLNRGECICGSEDASYLECFLYRCFGAENVHFLEKSHSIDEVQREELANKVFAPVVSLSRIDSVISNMHRTSQYAIDRETAVAYGGLQDFRSATGVSRETVILSKKRPERAGE